MPDGFWMGVATLVMGVLGFLPAFLGSRRKHAVPTHAAEQEVGDS